MILVYTTEQSAKQASSRISANYGIPKFEDSETTSYLPIHYVNSKWYIDCRDYVSTSWYLAELASCDESTSEMPDLI